jgi:tRNA pseudouridine38-40 synthase
MNQRYFIVLQYNGTRYCGWQKQPGVATVQDEINEKLSILLKSKIETTGAGRTDTGVHARYFVAHFDLDEEITLDQIYLVNKLNSFLPADIKILKIVKVANSAHARYDATSRTYKYYLSLEKEVFNKDFLHEYHGHLDLELMNQGAHLIQQYHDFTSFSKLHTDVKTNICTIEKAYWSKEESMLVFTITADRFLRNMVRSIVGTLILLGRHKIDMADLRIIIESKNRSNAGESVPAKGLFLEKISYPFDL